MYDLVVTVAFLHLIVIGVLAVWALTRVLLPNTRTVDIRKLRYLIAYSTCSTDSATREFKVYGAGTHHIPHTEKILTEIDTNPTTIDPPDEVIRAGNVECIFKHFYSYQFVGGGKGKDQRDDKALQDSILLAFERYDEPGQLDSVIKATVSQAVDIVGRAFKPNHLTSPDDYPCCVFTDQKTNVITRVISHDPGKPAPTDAYLVDTSEKLFEVMADAIKARADQTLGTFGVELVDFFIRDIAYKDAKLQERAEREHMADRLNAAVAKIMTDNNQQGISGQAALLVAMGQDSDFAKLVVQDKWRDFLKDLITPDRLKLCEDHKN